jgi:hypothetical protein
LARRTGARRRIRDPHQEDDTIGAQLNIDRAAFSEAFDNHPLGVSHRLADHPLLTVEAVAKLAETLPPESIEHNMGDLPTVVDPDAVERSELPVGEIARTIETNGCWMVMKNIEHEAAYRDLLNELLDSVSPLVEGRDGGMTDREGFIFLSAPDSVTPAHVDPEHNFLLQVRGTKAMTVGSFPDDTAKQLELEETFGGGGHRNIEWEPRDPRTFDMQPGDGVYVPPHAPHWVKNGPAASVSLSITFQTPANERTIRVHALNARLRRIGLSPTPPGRRPRLDRQKATCQRMMSRLRSTRSS